MGASCVAVKKPNVSKTTNTKNTYENIYKN